ncbi:helix-turn-helix domain-containing protein [Vibrio sp. SCSIO 43140]|uniref:substrate-binding domain-containing protein n=1 Tax=Vibrio sp. SCSIO 43140 TaxID=2819100 RepID=UPI002074E22A|nr:helix-turn-helix domain-containing protein [Vibrio sp. SCSIO 43140]USD59687.1 helix-turn-helix domain-containing protein [Vibrio sp. SCSIO 43140]
MKKLLILLDSMVYFDRQVLKGIKARSDESDLKLSLYLECASNLDYILSESWDYVIADYNKPAVKHLVDTLGAKRVVYANHSPVDLPDTLSSVILDNEGLARLAIRTFAKSGLMHVGYFANQQDLVTPWSQERHKAFQRAAPKHSLNYCDNVNDAIKSRMFPLGVYCSSDRSARRVAELCELENINVPEQVAIIGTDYDDTERLLSPMPLSSVELDPFELGRSCMETLEQVIRYKRSVSKLFSSNTVIHAKTTASEGDEDKVVVKAELYMRNHFHSNIKIKQVTDFCRISRKTLDTRFLIVHGVTAHQYLTNLRVERAKHLLETTNDRMESIAKQCGYPSQSYLSQVFIKQLGLSPAKYRQHNAKHAVVVL